MSKPLALGQSLLSVVVLALVFPLSRADVGTAAHYSPPYTPTACFGSDPSQFPSSNLFAAAGEGIWDNGAACGRQYLVKCISAEAAGTCSPDQTVQVRIIDRSESATSHASLASATIVLSTTAFESIVKMKTSVISINVEYQQV